MGAAWTGTEGERERERVRDYRGHLADERHRGSFAPIPFLSRQPSTVYLPRRGDGGPARSACVAPCQTLRGCLCFLGFFFLNRGWGSAGSGGGVSGGEVGCEAELWQLLLCSPLVSDGGGTKR